MSKHTSWLLPLCLLSLLLVAQVGKQGTPANAGLDYTEHFDVDDSLGDWHVAHSNWAVDDSILTLSPIGQSILYIYDPYWVGISWPHYDIHLGAKASGCAIKVQAAIWITNGTDWEDIWGDEFTLSETWTDYEWEYEDFYDASHLDGPLNLTEVDFFFWCPAGGYTRPGWEFNLQSIMDNPEAYIDYVSTAGNNWSDEVEDEIAEETSTPATSEAAPTTNESGGGLLEEGESGINNLLDSIDAVFDDFFEDLSAGEGSAWIIFIIVLFLLFGVLPYFLWGKRRKG